MIGLQVSYKIKNEIINAGETHRFSDSLVIYECCCRQCCTPNSGGLFCI